MFHTKLNNNVSCETSMKVSKNMNLLNECKQWLVSENNDFDNDLYELSDGGYYVRVYDIDDTQFNFEYNGAMCYDVDKVPQHTIKFSVCECHTDNLIIHFETKNARGTSHILSLDSFKLFIEYATR